MGVGVGRRKGWGVSIVAFSEMHSNTWQGEVFLAGAGFAINGQFIDRADNWENSGKECWHSRGRGLIAYQMGLGVELLIVVILKESQLAHA